MSSEGETTPAEFVLFETACGCVQWQRWMPEIFGPEIYMPLTLESATGYHSGGHSEFRNRKFRSEGLYRLEGTSSGTYYLYKEVVE